MAGGGWDLVSGLEQQLSGLSIGDRRNGEQPPGRAAGAFPNSLPLPQSGQQPISGTSSPPCFGKRNVKECQFDELESKIKKAQSKGKRYYIGYTEKETDYLCHTGPKSEKGKSEFIRDRTYYAKIEPSMGEVTEHKLVDKYIKDPLCTNGMAGRYCTDGIVYVVKSK